MRNSMHLSIQNPCSENYDQFKKTFNGGYCTSCAKEVIDFTNKSSEEIKNYFTNNTNKTCGRFKSEQLTTYTSAPKKTFSYFRMIGLTAITLFFSTNLAAQDTPNDIVNTIEQQTTSITGTVYSSIDNLPIPGVSIMLKNSTRGTDTNFNGKFTFNNLNIGDVITIHSLGYAEKNITITNTSKNLKIYLENDSEILGDVFVGKVDTNQHYKTKRNFWQKVKSIF